MKIIVPLFLSPPHYFGIDTLERPFLKESGLGYRSEHCTHGLIRTDGYVMCMQKRNVTIRDKHETMRR